MKKNYIPGLSILLFSIITTCGLQAQTKIGLRSGLNISNLNYYFNENKVEDQEAQNKIELGIFLEQGLHSKFDYVFEVNYFESGISIPSIPFNLTTKSLESNSILKFRILKGSFEPNVFAGIGINRYLQAKDSQGFTYDFQEDDIHAFGIGYLLGFQFDYNIKKNVIFFDARFKNSLSNFIDNATNEDFTIQVKKQETVLSLGFKYKLN